MVHFSYIQTLINYCPAGVFLLQPTQDITWVEELYCASFVHQHQAQQCLGAWKVEGETVNGSQARYTISRLALINTVGGVMSNLSTRAALCCLRSYLPGCSFYKISLNGVYLHAAHFVLRALKAGRPSAYNLSSDT